MAETHPLPPSQWPQPGRYRHYKGPEYELLHCATHSETGELLAVYRCLYGDFSVWARPLDMFVEQVEVDGKLIPRFQRLDNDAGER